MHALDLDLVVDPLGGAGGVGGTAAGGGAVAAWARLQLFK